MATSATPTMNNALAAYRVTAVPNWSYIMPPNNPKTEKHVDDITNTVVSESEHSTAFSGIVVFPHEKNPSPM